MALEAKDLAFYAVPLAIAAVAGFFAWRYFHDGPPSEPPNETPALRALDPCAVGRRRCRASRLEETTGERGDGGACEWKPTVACATACVAEGVTMFGPDEATARQQLCDPPAEVGDAVEAIAVEGITCDHDGIGPIDGGIVECILPSAKDPNALGLVVSAFRCRNGGVDTFDVTPTFVQREQAIAIWCKRGANADGGGSVVETASTTDAGTAPDAAKVGDGGDGGAHSPP